MGTYRRSHRWCRFHEEKKARYVGMLYVRVGRQFIICLWDWQREAETCQEPGVLVLEVAKEGRRDENQRWFPFFICSRIPVYCKYIRGVFTQWKSCLTLGYVKWASAIKFADIVRVALKITSRSCSSFNYICLGVRIRKWMSNKWNNTSMLRERVSKRKSRE